MGLHARASGVEGHPDDPHPTHETSDPNSPAGLPVQGPQSKMTSTPIAYSVIAAARRPCSRQVHARHGLRSEGRLTKGLRRSHVRRRRRDRWRQPRRAGRGLSTGAVQDVKGETDFALRASSAPGLTGPAWLSHSNDRSNWSTARGGACSARSRHTSAVLALCQRYERDSRGSGESAKSFM